MPQSDWGDWLPNEIAATTPSSITLWYLGCNGVVLKAADGTTVFIDPYLGLGDPPRTVRMIPVPFTPSAVSRVDAVLITHEHTDHLHGPTQGPLVAGTDARIIAPAGCRERVTAEFAEYPIDPDQFAFVRPGDETEVGTVNIAVEGAVDPDAEAPVSYLLSAAGKTVFHGGDARPSDQFRRIGGTYDIDTGFVAFGSPGMIPDKETGTVSRTKWYNDEAEAIEAARQLQLPRLIPTHWDMWKGLTADPTALVAHAKSFEYPERIDVLTIGDRRHL